MATTAYVFLLIAGCLNLLSLFNDKITSKGQALGFLFGLALLGFSVTALVIR